jgi:RNA polymerase sigma factor (sigma-70 family)
VTGRGQDGQRPGGDRFSEWYRTEYSSAVTTVRLAIGDDRLAEEAVSEAFARALASWPSVMEMASPNGWLYRVALNQARSWLRRRRRERRHLDTLPPTVHSPPAPDPDDRLWRAVKGLPPRARTAIALRYIADLQEKDVAAAMGVTRGAVATTLHRARAQLAKELSAELEEDHR